METSQPTSLAHAPGGSAADREGQVSAYRAAVDPCVVCHSGPSSCARFSPRNSGLSRPGPASKNARSVGRMLSRRTSAYLLRSGATSARLVETGTRQPRTGDLGPVRCAAGIRRVEPLTEELGQPGTACRALIWHPSMERRLELRLGDTIAHERALQLVQGIGGGGRPQNLG